MASCRRCCRGGGSSSSENCPNKAAVWREAPGKDFRKRLGILFSFYLPAFARNEAMLLPPGTEPLIETLARAPYVVLADLEPAAVNTRQQTADAFDASTQTYRSTCCRRL
jgi:hypothetical protein